MTRIRIRIDLLGGLLICGCSGTSATTPNPESADLGALQAQVTSLQTELQDLETRLQSLSDTLGPQVTNLLQRLDSDEMTLKTLQVTVDQLRQNSTGALPHLVDGNAHDLGLLAGRNLVVATINKKHYLLYVGNRAIYFQGMNCDGSAYVPTPEPSGVADPVSYEAVVTADGRLFTAGSKPQPATSNSILFRDSNGAVVCRQSPNQNNPNVFPLTDLNAKLQFDPATLSIVLQ